MKNIKALLIVAMSLATAWAIRGQFGHEQGAAWAGAIGGLALVLASGRSDWYRKIWLITLASAIGWGIGGMISYGMVVGYGRAENFVNAYYGLGMLFVIGGLFGLLGGGLVGLTLDSTSSNKVKWGALISQMTAGGLVFYFFLVYQIGFKMTPPRSEAWAFCLGAGMAMLWYMAREKRNSAIRVAIFSMLGGGIGFSFGNFLQIGGDVLEIQFNMWNVMEYSIGFFGGLGMAYGVFSSRWPENVPEPKKWENWTALILVGVFIPLIVFRETLSYSRFIKRFENLPDVQSLATDSTVATLVLLVALILLLVWKMKNYSFKRKDALINYFALFIIYMVFSYLIKGLLAGNTEINHHLYVVNILVLYLLMRKEIPAFFNKLTDAIPVSRWMWTLVGIAGFIALLAWVAISIHTDIGGHDRFPLE